MDIATQGEFHPLGLMESTKACGAFRQYRVQY